MLLVTLKLYRALLALLWPYFAFFCGIYLKILFSIYFRTHFLMVEVTDLPECSDLSANTKKRTEVRKLWSFIGIGWRSRLFIL